MPNPTLSQALAEAYASCPTDVVILHTLEFRHPVFTSPIRVVRDQADLTATLEAAAPANPGEVVLFLRYPFDLELPEVSDRGTPQVTITIDNVTAEIGRQIDAAVSEPDPIEVTYRAFLSSDLAGPQNDPPLTLSVTRIEVDVFRVTATATLLDLGNRQFPNEDYTATRFPGLVR